MGSPEITLGLVSNVWTKQMVFNNIGDKEEGHCHIFDHATLLAYGGLEVTANGKTTKFIAPTMIWIRAGIEHELVATMPKTVAYCIHALRDGDNVGDIIDPSMIPEGTNPSKWFDNAKPLTTPFKTTLSPVPAEFLDPRSTTTNENT